MLDYPGVVRRFGTGATHAIACNSDQEVGDISKIDSNTVNSCAVYYLDQFRVSKNVMSCFSFLPAEGVGYIDFYFASRSLHV